MKRLAFKLVALFLTQFILIVSQSFAEVVQHGTAEELTAYINQKLSLPSSSTSLEGFVDNLEERYTFIYSLNGTYCRFVYGEKYSSKQIMFISYGYGKPWPHLSFSLIGVMHGNVRNFPQLPLHALDWSPIITHFSADASGKEISVLSPNSSDQTLLRIQQKTIKTLVFFSKPEISVEIFPAQSGDLPFTCRIGRRSN